jgi:CDGSH-type Zn-finger protein
VENRNTSRSSVKPSIVPRSNGPYVVKDLRDLRNSKGEPIKTEREMYLCRCGGSGNKPFCDGTHLKIGLRDNKSEDRVPDRLDGYAGKELTIHDNRGVCSHAGYCTNNLPSVFKIGSERWIDPDAACQRNKNSHNNKDVPIWSTELCTRWGSL